MCHIDKDGDGCHGKGVGGCGGNLLQTNMTAGTGYRGVADRVRSQLLSLQASISSYRSLRGTR